MLLVLFSMLLVAAACTSKDTVNRKIVLIDINVKRQEIHNEYILKRIPFGNWDWNRWDWNNYFFVYTRYEVRS